MNFLIRIFFRWFLGNSPIIARYSRHSMLAHLLQPRDLLQFRKLVHDLSVVSEIFPDICSRCITGGSSYCSWRCASFPCGRSSSGCSGAAMCTLCSIYHQRSSLPARTRRFRCLGPLSIAMNFLVCIFLNDL